MKKEMIFILLVSIVLTVVLGFVPVKRAEFESGGKARPEDTVAFWYLSGKQSYDSNILEYVDEPNRPHWKLSGSDIVGEDVEYNDTPVYYRVWWNSPLWLLNSWFSPKEAENYFAVKYYPIQESEWKEDHYERTILIENWVPIYPIRRSGWLANKLLPEEYLTLWDFIGWRACW